MALFPLWFGLPQLLLHSLCTPGPLPAVQRRGLQKVAGVKGNSDLGMCFSGW